MKRIIKSILQLWLCAHFFTPVQSQVKALKAGEKIPDIPVQHVWNYTRDNIRLADYRGKVVLLDFWSPGCISCLGSFPYMDSVQKKFKDNLQVFLVNKISSDSTAKFFKRRKRVLKPDIPIITGDRLLGQWFPHEGVPFQVWIDQDGKVLYTGTPYYATFENIQKVINRETVSIVKTIKKTYAENLFDPQWKNQIITYSCLTSWKEGLHLETGGKKGYAVINTSTSNAIQLYQQAWDGLTGGQYNFYKRPGITDVQGLADRRYKKPTHGLQEWKEQNWFTYQLCIPDHQKERKYSIMKEELDRYFDIASTIEKRFVACYVLTQNSQEDKLKTIGGVQTDDWDGGSLHSDKKDTVTHLQNLPASLFFTRLKDITEWLGGKPFINETGYTGNIDMEFGDAEVKSITSLISMLKRYGLELTEKKVELTVLVLSEKEKGTGMHPSLIINNE
jgi:thiol-disulfide isomerase/thioredoxin